MASRCVLGYTSTGGPPNSWGGPQRMARPGAQCPANPCALGGLWNCATKPVHHHLQAGIGSPLLGKGEHPRISTHLHASPRIQTPNARTNPHGFPPKNPRQLPGIRGRARHRRPLAGRHRFLDKLRRAKLTQKLRQAATQKPPPHCET